MKVFIALSVLIAVALAEPPAYRQQYQRQRQFQQQQQEEPSPAAPYPNSGWRPDGPAFVLPQRQFQIQAQTDRATAQRQYPAFQRQYGAPAAPQQQYGAPAAPQQQYGAPAAPQQQYGAPAAPQQQYGAPAAPQQQYGAPVIPQRQYGAPVVPQQQYGVPPEETTEVPNTTEQDEATTVATSTESESEPVDSVNELEDEDVDANQQQQQQEGGEYYVALPDGGLQRVQIVKSREPESPKYFAKIRVANVEPLREPVYVYTPLQKLQVVPSQLRVSVDPVPSVAIAAVETKPQKLKIEPVAQLEYRYENLAPVIPIAPQAAATPVSSSYTTYTANYKTPEPVYRVTLQ